MIDVTPTLNRKDLIAREALAIERTALANERTFLSVIRTCFTISIGGITLIKFIENPWIHMLGWVFIIGSLCGFAVGVVKFRQTALQIDKIFGKLPFMMKDEKALAIEEDLLED